MRIHLEKIKIILCDIINPVSDRQADLTRNGAAVMKNKDLHQIQGYVFSETGRSDYILDKYKHSKYTEIIDRTGYLMLPSFFDTHFHWVQDDVREMPKEDLLNWLNEFVWPHESGFRDPAYSEYKARAFAEKLISAGTLGGACYSSIHSHTVDHALKFFKGSFTVGNVLMTMNSPDFLLQTESDALNSVKEKSELYREKYAATPRFAPTAGPDVMKKASEYACHNNSFIQTHLSETVREIDFVLSIYRKIKGFEDVKNYTEIYSRCGLLGQKTIMGHCIHVSDEELELLKKSGTSIAHCPSSNAPIEESGLGSGLFDFRKAEKAGVRWALASDIGGGPFLSMFDVMRSFVQQNRNKNIKEASYIKALYRATAAGAEIMGLKESHGNLDCGKTANFILVDSPKEIKNETSEDILKTVCESRSCCREKYIEIVKSTFLEGEEIFTR